VAILNWNREGKNQHLGAHERERLIKQQDTVRTTLLLTPTTDNPMDEMYHPIILDSPWTAPLNIENKIQDLIGERKRSSVTYRTRKKGVIE
jgi:hypothetical protein